MEVPNLVLDDPQMAGRVTELLKPLVITQEMKSRMVKVLEEELDLGHQYGLEGKEQADRFCSWIEVNLYPTGRRLFIISIMGVTAQGLYITNLTKFLFGPLVL